jgi:hypothetical protein
LVWIADRAAGSDPTTSSELRSHVTPDGDFPVSRACVNSVIGRHSRTFCKMKSWPQEAERLEIPRCFVHGTLPCLTKFVQDPPTELAFNLAPVAIFDWKDRHGPSLFEHTEFPRVPFRSRQLCFVRDYAREVMFGKTKFKEALFDALDGKSWCEVGLRENDFLHFWWNVQKRSGMYVFRTQVRNELISLANFFMHPYNSEVLIEVGFDFEEPKQFPWNAAVHFVK